MRNESAQFQEKMKRRSFALALYHSLSLSCILPV